MFLQQNSEQQAENDELRQRLEASKAEVQQLQALLANHVCCLKGAAVAIPVPVLPGQNS